MKLRALLLCLIVTGFAAPTSAQVDFIYGQLAHPCSALGNNFVTGAINECIDPTTNDVYYYNGSWIPISGPSVNKLNSVVTIKPGNTGAGGAGSSELDFGTAPNIWQMFMIPSGGSAGFYLFDNINGALPFDCLPTAQSGVDNCAFTGIPAVQNPDGSQVILNAPANISGTFWTATLPPAPVTGGYWYDAAGNGVLTEFNPGTPAALSSFGTCNSAHEGQYRTQTNSTAGCSAGATATSSGTTHCAIYCNGTNWKQTGL